MNIVRDGRISPLTSFVIDGRIQSPSRIPKDRGARARSRFAKFYDRCENESKLPCYCAPRSSLGSPLCADPLEIRADRGGEEGEHVDVSDPREGIARAQITAIVRGRLKEIGSRESGFRLFPLPSVARRRSPRLNDYARVGSAGPQAR